MKKQQKFLTATLSITALFILTYLSSCNRESDGTSQSQITVDCISQDVSIATRVELENGIRGQVKFIDEPEDLRTITDEMSEYNIPALSLAVIKQGEIDWADTFVNPAFTDSLTIDCSSVFQAASLSKPVTFMAALRMHDAGEIDLDKNIEEYLQEFSLPQGAQTEENPVTLRNIFAHTSGITAGGFMGYDRSESMPSDLDVLTGAEGVNSQAIEVLSEPNQSLAYSGGAYTLAEVALQDIYNEEFAAIMKKWILEPAGMDHSEFTQPMPSEMGAKVAKGFTGSGEILNGGWRNHPEQAAAGLWSNAADLSNFLIEIYRAYNGESSVFSKSDIETILADERYGQSYGFILNRTEDDIAITHYGGNAGYRTGMTISLTSGNGLVYLINSDNGGSLGNALLLSAAQVYDWQHFPQTSAERDTVTADVLKELPGQYKWNDQIDLSVTYDEASNQISLFFPNGDEYKLTPTVGEDLDFIHANTGVTLTFHEADNFNTFTLYQATANKLN